MIRPGGNALPPHLRPRSAPEPTASVIPLIRVITQNALSVIQDTGLLPAPIAIAR